MENSEDGSEPGHRKGLPILIVDDDPSFLSIVTAALSRAGWRYEVATTGQHAIACLTSRSFQAVLLDLKLPDISGLDVLRQTAAILSFPPVVLISGDASIKSAFEAAQLGADGFLEKPIGMVELVATITCLAQTARPTVPSHLSEPGHPNFAQRMPAAHRLAEVIWRASRQMKGAAMASGLAPTPSRSLRRDPIGLTSLLV